MTRKYHNHKLQKTAWHGEEEPLNHHETTGRQFKQSNQLSLPHHHTGQCKRTGGCYNELVVAFFSTGGGLKGKKSIPVDFIIYL